MQTYSRGFLLGLPEERKQREFEMIVRSFIIPLKQAAEDDKKSYFFDMTNMRKITPDIINKRCVETFAGISSQTTMTNEEIINRIGKAFPDCSVVYTEDWVETNASTKILKRGITIDWS